MENAERNELVCVNAIFNAKIGRIVDSALPDRTKCTFISKLLDFKNDVRKGAEPRKFNYQPMIDAAKDMTEE